MCICLLWFTCGCEPGLVRYRPADGDGVCVCVCDGLFERRDLVLLCVFSTALAHTCKAPPAFNPVSLTPSTFLITAAECRQVD